MDNALPAVKFAASQGFQRALQQRVDVYFETTGQSERDCRQMYLKTACILCWTVASYLALVFLADTWWLALPLAISLGFAMAAVGFNIQHDGSHHAYSNRRWVNSLMAMSLDLLGGSSYVWARKHNVVHHSFSNITHYDDDINIGFFGRLSPHQKRLGVHRLQHFYMWILYGLLPIKWQIHDDFRDVITGRIGEHPFKRPGGWDLVTFILGKATFLTLAFVIPLSRHSLGAVLPLYLAASFSQGVLLSVVFQLAHCVEDAAFPLPQPDNGRMKTDWAVHQVETTVDFARDSRLLSWLIGGLNFQIEHHLFPRICHIHYRAISHVVEETCAEFGVAYAAHPTIFASLTSHFRWLRRMGLAPVAQLE